MVLGSPDGEMKQSKVNAYGRVPSRGGKDAAPLRAGGQSGGSILPLDVIQPEPRRLCHVSRDVWVRELRGWRRGDG